MYSKLYPSYQMAYGGPATVIPTHPVRHLEHAAMSILTAAVHALQWLQQGVPGYRKEMLSLLADDFETMEVVIWPGRFTVDFDSPFKDEVGRARGRFLAVLPHPIDVEREELIRRVTAKVPVPLEDVEDASRCYSDSVDTGLLLVAGRLVVMLWSRRRDPLAAFHKRSESRRYLAAYELERTHPAFACTA